MAESSLRPPRSILRSVGSSGGSSSKRKLSWSSISVCEEVQEDVPVSPQVGGPSMRRITSTRSLHLETVEEAERRQAQRRLDEDAAERAAEAAKLAALANGGPELIELAKTGSLERLEALWKLHGSKLDVEFKSPAGLTSAHRASSSGHAAFLRFLLSTCGAKVNSRDDDLWTPLMYAATDGHLECVRLLLELGANPSLAGNDRKTARQLALESRHNDIVALLPSSNEPATQVKKEVKAVKISKPASTKISASTPTPAANSTPTVSTAIEKPSPAQRSSTSSTITGVDPSSSNDFKARERGPGASLVRTAKQHDLVPLVSSSAKTATPVEDISKISSSTSRSARHGTESSPAPAVSRDGDREVVRPREPAQKPAEQPVQQDGHHEDDLTARLKRRQVERDRRQAARAAEEAEYEARSAQRKREREERRARLREES